MARTHEIPTEWRSRYLTTEEAARYLGISGQALRHLVRQGTIPAMALGPKRLRFTAAGLDEAMAALSTSGRKPSTTPETLDA